MTRNKGDHFAKDTEALVLAAAQRARVLLDDGRTGVLVYAPGGRRASMNVRTGHPEQCAVRIDGEGVEPVAVEPTAIAEVWL